jgi:hypothetical protein
MYEMHAIRMLCFILVQSLLLSFMNLQRIFFLIHSQDDAVSATDAV